MSEIEQVNEEILEETTPEELPMEDKKKAINLQDLIYIKKYLDDGFYTKEGIDAMLTSMVTEKVTQVVTQKCYTKEETKDLFYEVTDTVANATNAEFAAYASEDKTKGTLEERLTGLGFKEGAVEYLVNTASINYLKRQGNYVFGELVFDDTAVLKPPSDMTWAEYPIGILPINFRPKQTITTYTPFKAITSHIVGQMFYGVAEVRIEPDTGKIFIGNVIWCDQLTQYTGDPLTYSSPTAYLITPSQLAKTRITFGFEAHPIV